MPGIGREWMAEMVEQAKARGLTEAGYHGFIAFDEMTIQGDLQLKRHGDQFEVTGLTNKGEFNETMRSIQAGKEEAVLSTHVLQFTFFSAENFIFPIAFYPTANLDGVALYDMYWNCIRALLLHGFNSHMAVCDGGQANRTFILLHFENEEHAIRSSFVTTNRYNGESHIFMMDPSHNFQKLRNNVEKSSCNGKTTRHLIYNGCPILWSHWKSAYEFDCTVCCPRTYAKFSDAHFVLTPSSRMRNHLADDVLCKRMNEILGLTTSML
eukprot:Seg2427.7 transcript_id=Seg2427.7/GoldUCD/mRNA.D3Y31 product="hypothetical protein" protein_id=Seg2427.7/GoldUCD/D3Y31